MDITSSKNFFDEDSREVFSILERLKEGATYLEVSIEAINLICKGTRLEKEIWEWPGQALKSDIFEAGLSGGETLLAKVCLSIWTFGVEEAAFDIYSLYASLDAQKQRRFFKAMMLLTYFDSKCQLDDEKTRAWAERMAKESF